jgi:hypothetical protein
MHTHADHTGPAPTETILVDGPTTITDGPAENPRPPADREADRGQPMIAARTLGWTMAGVIVAAVIGAITIWLMSQQADPLAPAPAQPQESRGQGGTINGNGNVVTNTYSEFQQQAPPGASIEQLQRAAEKYADVPPPSSPAAFRVVNTGDMGLKVRTSGATDGVQIGSAAQDAVVWVNCRATTDFDPVLDDQTGASWFLIRWPSTVPGSSFRNSEPGGPAQGWIYAGYTLPAGHNGQVPSC